MVDSAYFSFDSPFSRRGRALGWHIALLGFLGSAACSSSSDDAGTTKTFSDSELTAQHCQLGGAVTAYVAGSSSSPGANAAALVPCFQLFGVGAAEPTLTVSKTGSVTYAPVFPDDGVGLWQTHDHGQSWNFLFPADATGAMHGRAQPYLYLDPKTDRQFFASTALGGTHGNPGFDLSWSADDGVSWNYVNVAANTSDWAKIYAGPPATSTTVGYPTVVYLSAPSPISTPLNGAGPSFQAVYKSLDGGVTWASVGGEALTLQPALVPGCTANEWIIYGNGVVGPDGTVYISLHRCGRLAIAISGDEGATWNVVDIPGTSLPQFDSSNIAGIVTSPNMLLTEPLAADSDGTLYMVWPDDTKLFKLSVSRDKGLTWSAPVVVSEPSVTSVVYGSVAVKAPGTIAIAYYGSEDGTRFDGYMAESLDALAPAPHFSSARVSDPSDPLFPEGYDVGYVRLFSGGDLHEIVKVEYAPNGDIWAAFAKDMCPGLGAATDNCTWDMAAHTNSHYQGAVGRLVHR
jgi:hypothetical protein